MSFLLNSLQKESGNAEARMVQIKNLKERWENWAS